MSFLKWDLWKQAPYHDLLIMGGLGIVKALQKASP
jgi:hypothetical protein